MKTVAASVLALIVAQAVVTEGWGQSTEYNPVHPRPQSVPVPDEIIVKWRGGDTAKTAADSPAKVRKLSTTVGLGLQSKQRMTGDTEVLKLDQPVSRATLNSVLQQIAADGDVEYAVPNEHRWAHALPNDPIFPAQPVAVPPSEGQWYFRNVQPAGIRAEEAWDVTVGSSTTVVAVLDTGVRFEHPDLGRATAGGKLLDGFDFVSSLPVANDGDGLDADASDPGDWINAGDRSQPQFSNCDISDSSWHGTRVSSLIGALTNNAEGIAGASWNALILPVRVLGKCGGSDSDILNGMRWAAGLPVFGAPANPTRAKIINLSLGGDGFCSPAYQSAVNEIVAQGIVVVVSAGNDGGPVSTPANCSGVIGVTGLRHIGTKVGFSNLGTEVSIAAPGGNCVNTAPGTPCQFSIVAATNDGATTPTASTYTTPLDFNVGTSFSSPLVAGAAALMHAVNSQLTPTQYRLILRDSAAPFPNSSPNTTTVCHVPISPADVQNQECICTTQTCGAGMLDTRGAVLATQRPFAAIQTPTSITTGVDISIDARSSFAPASRTITTYQWSAVNITGATPVFANASQSLSTYQVAGDSQFTLRLTITDDAGGQDTADVAVATPPAVGPPSPPASVPRSGGGGGNIGLLMLGLGALALFRQRRRSTVAGRSMSSL